MVLGILVAYASNFGLENAHLGMNTWRWQLGVAGLPAVLFLVLLFGVPRSARWLITQNRVDEAREALGLLGSPDPEAEIAELRSVIHVEQKNVHAPLFTKRLKLPIFLAVSIGLFNQLAGINAILYYLGDIFRAGGLSQVSSDEQSVLIGLMNFLATLLAMTMIDKLGRKTLLLVGSVGTALCLAGIAAIFELHQHLSLLLWLLVGYTFFFSISQGAVIWVYISEVFPTEVRSKGQSLGSGAHWIANATISFLFPIVARHSNGLPFAFFCAMMVLQFFVVLFIYPETKGVSLEQLQKQLGTAD